MTDTNKMREDFEVWIKSQGCYFGGAPESLSRCDEEPDEYLCGAVHGAWLGWQASRQAVVVDLPTFHGYKEHIVRELQAAFTGACEARGLRVGVRK